MQKRFHHLTSPIFLSHYFLLILLKILQASKKKTSYQNKNHNNKDKETFSQATPN